MNERILHFYEVRRRHVGLEGLDGGILEIPDSGMFLVQYCRSISLFRGCSELLFKDPCRLLQMEKRLC